MTAWHDPDGSAMAGDPPRAIFADRVDRVVECDGSSFVVSFLNREHRVHFPIAWNPGMQGSNALLWLHNLHYHEFLEALPAELAARVMCDWIEQVKPYTAGYWLDTWNSYALSIRVVVWMQLLAADRVALNTAERRRVLGSLLAQLRFLERNLEVDIRGNHLLKNIKALLWGAAFFDAPDATRWRATAQNLLWQELEEQVLADGMHFELSPSYHNQVFCDLIEIHHVLGDESKRQRLEPVLHRMAHVVADFQHPDGQVSLFNDGGLHAAYEPDEALDIYRDRFGRVCEPAHHLVYAASGYYGLRTPDSLFIADCGALAPDHLPAHGHGDALGFEWSFEGRRIFVDPGVFEYSPGPMRAYSRATSSHNTVTIDGLDQSEFWSAFRVGRRARIVRCEYRQTVQGFELVGAHDGYTRSDGAPVHERRFVVGPRTVSLTDTIRGGAGQACAATLLLHPACRIECKDAHTGIVQCGPVRLTIESDAPMRVEAASYHPDKGVNLETSRVVIDLGAADGQLSRRIDIRALDPGR